MIRKGVVGLVKGLVNTGAEQAADADIRDDGAQGLDLTGVQNAQRQDEVGVGRGPAFARGRLNAWYLDSGRHRLLGGVAGAVSAATASALAWFSTSRLSRARPRSAMNKPNRATSTPLR